jgi:general L-amino acid transport system substrate-binding protein
MAAVAALLFTAPAQAGATLDAIKQRGFVQCGASPGSPGFVMTDSQGRWTGMDVELCRSLAVAVFGDPEKIRFRPLTAAQRFPALQAGEVDVLAPNVTWTSSRDATLGFVFAAITYYDGQGIIVPKALKVTSAKQLDGATVCVQPGTTLELNITDFFRANKISFKPVVIENLDEVEAAFFAGRCDAYTTVAAKLGSVRAARATNADDYVILPERISKEPLAFTVRQGDNQWVQVVRWTVNALLQAEESGITSQNIDSFRNSTDPTIQRLVGKTPGMGEAMGVPETWAYNVIKQLGNYSEIFERNIGKNSPLKLERGLNALWTQGGLMYPLPIR